MSTPRITPTALITGASRGLGKSMAFELARRGYNLVLCARSGDLLRQHCDAITAAGGHAVFLPCDVRDYEQMRAVIALAMERFGRIDVAILNAGIGLGVGFADATIDKINAVFDVNVRGVCNGLELIVPIMKQQGGGNIAGISSLADGPPLPGSGVYVASKAAATSILDAAHIDMHAFNIRVSTVRPGYVHTDMTAGNTAPMPFVMSADRAARIIVSGILRNRARISFPWPMALGAALIKVFPARVWALMWRGKQHSTLTP